MSGDNGDLVPQEYDDAEPGWAPRGEHDVEMALRGLERLAAKFTAIGQQAVAYRADIEAWEQAEVHRLRARATNLVLGLQAYARERRLISKGKDKSLRFPSGVLETRAGRGKVAVEDEPVLLAWCKASVPDAVKVVESVLTSILMKAPGVGIHPEDLSLTVQRLICDGEEIPGVHYLAGGETRITVEVKLASQRSLPALGSSDA